LDVNVLASAFPVTTGTPAEFVARGLPGVTMPEQRPDIQTMKISNVKAKLFSLVDEVYRQERRILVEKADIPVAALISAQDLELL
jgi:hypothetical protein